MAKINLLDWRGELRTRKRNEFYKMLGFTALVALMMVAAMMMASLHYRRQQDRNFGFQEVAARKEIELPAFLRK